MDFTSLSHKEFIRHIAGKCADERSWTEFVNRYHKTIAGAVGKRMGGSRFYQDLEDVVQEVYFILRNHDCKVLVNFKGKYENSIFSFLRMISINRSTKWMMQNGKEDPRDEIEQFLKELEVIISDSWEYSELLEEIEDCLSTLTKRSRHSERDKLIFRFRYLEDLSPEEIANHLNDHEEKLTAKRIWGILTELRKGMQSCLKEKLN